MVSLFLFGCGVKKQFTSRIAKCYIGMPISEFQDVFKNYDGLHRAIRLEELTPKRTVYRVYNAYAGTKFIYFDSNGKLFSIDEGVDRPDINMQINQNINRN